MCTRVRVRVLLIFDVLCSSANAAPGPGWISFSSAAACAGSSSANGWSTFFCCLSRQPEHFFSLPPEPVAPPLLLWTEPGDPPTAGPGLLAGPVVAGPVVALAVDANGAGPAVEWSVQLAVELAEALGTRSLVVGVMVKKKRHGFCFGKAWTPFTLSPRCVGITCTV